MSNAPFSETSDQTVELLKRIPLFERLILPELQQVFDICTLQRYRARETLYRVGLPSLDMFILLEGNLSVRTSGGVEVARISPVDLVGEMGLLADSPRSAEVITLDNVMGLLIHKDDLTALFLRNTPICIKMLLNVIKIISQKVHNTNAQIERLKTRAPNLSKELDDILSGNVFLY